LKKGLTDRCKVSRQEGVRAKSRTNGTSVKLENRKTNEARGTERGEKEGRGEACCAQPDRALRSGDEMVKRLEKKNGKANKGGKRGRK